MKRFFRCAITFAVFLLCMIAVFEIAVHWAYRTTMENMEIEVVGNQAYITVFDQTDVYDIGK